MSLCSACALCVVRAFAVHLYIFTSNFLFANILIAISIDAPPSSNLYTHIHIYTELGLPFRSIAIITFVAVCRRRYCSRRRHHGFFLAYFFSHFYVRSNLDMFSSVLYRREPTNDHYIHYCILFLLLFITVDLHIHIQPHIFPI